MQGNTIASALTCSKTPHRLKLISAPRVIKKSSDSISADHHPTVTLFAAPSSHLECGCARGIGCSFRHEPMVVSTAPVSNDWFVVLLTRKRKNRGVTRERISIRITPRVEEMLQPNTRTAQCRTTRTSTLEPGWSIIALVGPLPTETEATLVCNLWSRDSRVEMTSRVAKAEAIAMNWKVPGYVDWSKVFGSSI